MKILEAINFYLNEEFGTGIKINNNYYEIFINPTEGEMENLKKEYGGQFRFIIDIKNQKIYVFPSELLHHYVSSKYKIPYHEQYNKPDSPYIYGQGVFKNGKIIVSPLYFNEIAEKKYNKIKDEKWVSKYIRIMKI